MLIINFNYIFLYFKNTWFYNNFFILAIPLSLMVII